MSKEFHSKSKIKNLSIILNKVEFTLVLIESLLIESRLFIQVTKTN